MKKTDRQKIDRFTFSCSCTIITFLERKVYCIDKDYTTKKRAAVKATKLKSWYTCRL